MKEIFEKCNYYYGLSTLPSVRITCGWCNSIISPNKGYSVRYNSSQSGDIGYIYICPNCNQVILYRDYQKVVFPLCKFGKSINKLPEQVSLIYNEIRECYSIGAFTSIGLLGRKLLMHVAVQEGAEEDKSFLYYVNYLNDNRYVPKKSKHLLEFLRSQGNDANHFVQILQKEEAEKIISFIELILTFIYEYADDEEV